MSARLRSGVALAALASAGAVPPIASLAAPTAAQADEDDDPGSGDPAGGLPPGVAKGLEDDNAPGDPTVKPAPGDSGSTTSWDDDQPPTPPPTPAAPPPTAPAAPPALQAQPAAPPPTTTPAPTQPAVPPAPPEAAPPPEAVPPVTSPATSRTTVAKATKRTHRIRHRVSAAVPASRPASRPAPDVVAPTAPVRRTTAAPRRALAVPGHYVVQAGDTLWSIARAALETGATQSEIAAFVERIWAANGAAIGTGSPDMIVTGTQLRLPSQGEPHR